MDFENKLPKIGCFADDGLASRHNAKQLLHKKHGKLAYQPRCSREVEAIRTM
jgi:hypothetical protein